MELSKDKRIVLTLDAGGTNFVFNAMQANLEITDPIILSPHTKNLDKCIATIEDGFKAIMNKIKGNPFAISFAFPGPVDCKKGIVGDLSNFPAYRGGVPLGPILESKFNLPVFINNDVDLYTYGEALSGFLPYINQLLKDKGIARQYHNLMGFTLGTGFGGGLVVNEELIRGDNSAAGEVWLFRNRINPSTNAEEGISIRAIKRVYAEQSGMDFKLAPEPKDIFEIALGRQKGNSNAAKEAFNQLGRVLGDVLANLITVFDSAVVIGGGLSGAMELIFPAMLAEIESQYTNYNRQSYPRLAQKVFNMGDKISLEKFLDWKEVDLKVPGLNESVKYSQESRIPIGISQIGTSRAISLGAYAYALNSTK